MSKWTENKRELIEVRGSVCELCKARPVADQDHAIFPKCTGVRIDDEENIILLCAQCNRQHKEEKNYSPHPSFRVWAWHTNCERYGENHMREWLEGLELKVKPRF